MQDVAGTELKGYHIEGMIDAGNFGAVYRAKQKIIEREVAIKVLWPVLAGRPDFIRKFEAEAQLVAGLEHPHIVPLYDYWRDPNGAYIVMRWLRGGHLRNSLMKNPLPIEQALRIAEQIGSALAFAHRDNIIHLDLKPENVLLDEHGNVYLADFGISQIVRTEDTGNDITELGSLAYAAPEQFTSETISPQTDQYSLGVLLYELIAGQHPIPDLIELTPDAAVQKRINTPIPSIRRVMPDIPRELDVILQRVTTRDPLKRFSSMDRLLTALRGVLNPEAIVIEDASTREDIPNPYKGLRTFQEADAANFFGRDALTKQLIARLEEQHEYAHFLAVVGPSGSGKSSVVKAGLMPVLRQGGIAGSDSWFYVEMVPGVRPFEELAAALVSVATSEPPRLAERLREDNQSLAGVLTEILPDDKKTELFLFIDQFEEVFTLVSDEAESTAFLELLYHAITNPNGRLRIVITLRADFYDRPLLRPIVSDLMSKRTEVVIPLLREELQQAITLPARRVGVTLELQLVQAVIDEVIDQPATLPLLQYLMSEMFERRKANVLTYDSYQEMGGVRGALARRADELYEQADDEQQLAIRQLMLRLITLGEGTEDTRRRVSLSELNTLFAEKQLVMRAAIDKLGKSRLITFDRDPVTRTPTVEVTHEAIIREWKRLRAWLDSSRDDLRLQRALTHSTEDWINAGRERSYLLTGARLGQYQSWMKVTSVALNQQEREFYEACLAEQQAQEQREQERIEHERRLEIRARNRLRILVGVLTLAATISITLTVFALDQSRRAQLESQLSLSLVQESSARQALRDGDSDLAVVLALSANEIPNASAQAWRALTEVAFASGTRQLLAGHTSVVTDVAISPDGRWLASASRDRSLRIWEIESGQAVHVLIGHRGDVQTVAIAPDSRHAVTGGLDFEAVLWDIIDGVELQRFIGHTANILDVNFSPDGESIVTGSRDNTAILWDVNTGEIIRRFEGHVASVQTAEIDANGERLATGAGDGLIIIWDVTTGEEIRRLNGHTTAVNDVDFSTSGTLLASASADETVIIWDVTTGEIVRRFDGLGAGVNTVEISPAEDVILIGTLTGTAYLLDVQTGREVGVLRGHTGEITSLSLGRDGRLAATSSTDLTVRLWNIRNPTEIALRGHSGRVTGMAYSTDSTQILTGAVDGTLRTWDAQTGISSVFAVDEAVRTMAVNDVGSQALIGLPGGVVQVWDMVNGTLTNTYTLHSGVVLALDFSRDGRLAVSASQDGTIALWDIATGTVEALIDREGAVFSIALSPDARRLLIGTAEGAVILWDISTGTEIRRLQGHTDVVWTIAISMDGRTALTGSRDGNVIWWDMETGREQARLSGHTDVVWDVDFNRAGDLALSGSGDGTVILWSLAAGQVIQQFSPGTPVFQVAFSPDGQYIAAGVERGTVWQWRAFTLDTLRDWTRANRYVRDLTCLERSLFRVEPFCDS